MRQLLLIIIMLLPLMLVCANYQFAMELYRDGLYDDLYKAEV